MSVKRYSLHLSIPGSVELNESLHGSLVKYHDYAALEARCAALAAENSGLKEALWWLYETVSSDGVSIPDEKYSSVTNAAQVLSETPATDSFLAEVRAQGVDSAINAVIAMMNHQHPVTSKAIDILRVHAYQVRKGVQS